MPNPTPTPTLNLYKLSIYYNSCIHINIYHILLNSSKIEI